MNSFAFWYEKKPGETVDLQATVHFNLFYGCGWEHEPFLDIGFMVEKISSADKLCFFMPFEIREDEKTRVIEDLGKKLGENDVLDAIFNNSYRIENESVNKYFVAHEQYNENEKFIVYNLDISNDLQLEGFTSDHGDGIGTIVSIKTENLAVATENGMRKCYLRFRIKNTPLNFLIHEYTMPHKALQNVFHTTYMVDFRYNNIRSLPKSIVERMRGKNSGIVKVKALHFLLITKAYVTVENGSFSRVRIIEHGVWQSYVSDTGEERDTKDLVAYHYIDKNKEGESEKNGMYPSELFTKFQIEKTVVSWYLLLTVALGAGGSGLVELFKFLGGLLVDFLTKS